MTFQREMRGNGSKRLWVPIELGTRGQGRQCGQEAPRIIIIDATYQSPDGGGVPAVQDGSQPVSHLENAHDSGV